MHATAPEASIGVTLGFIVLPVLMLVVLAVGAYAATVRAGDPARARQMALRFGLGGAVVMALTGGLAAAGAFANFGRIPPGPMLAFGLTFALVFAVGLSRAGALLMHLPVVALVGFQAFRIGVETLMHQAALEGVMPPQMSWDGSNFDVVSGILGLVIGLWAAFGTVPKPVLWAFNITGITLLMVVVAIATVSMPTPFQLLTPDNTWIAFFPFIWLPIILVSMALLGHIVLFRRLWCGPPK